jgi:hypothetical protein
MGIAPLTGAAATAPAATAGPGAATDTAVRAWYDGHRYLPSVFAASAVSAAGGLGCAVPRSPRTSRCSGSAWWPARRSWQPRR